MYLSCMGMRADLFSSSYSPVAEEDRGDDGDFGDEGVNSGFTPREGVRQRRQEGGEGGLLSRRLSEKTAVGGKAPPSAKLDYRNPMFHAANGTAEKAVAR